MGEGIGLPQGAVGQEDRHPGGEGDLGGRRDAVRGDIPPELLHTGGRHPVAGGIGDGEAPDKVGELPAARHDQHRTPDLPEDIEQGGDPVKEASAHFDDQRGCE